MVKRSARIRESDMVVISVNTVDDSYPDNVIIRSGPSAQTANLGDSYTPELDLFTPPPPPIEDLQSDDPGESEPQDA